MKGSPLPFLALVIRRQEAGDASFWGDAPEPSVERRAASLPSARGGRAQGSTSVGAQTCKVARVFRGPDSWARLEQVPVCVLPRGHSGQNASPRKGQLRLPQEAASPATRSPSPPPPGFHPVSPPPPESLCHPHHRLPTALCFLQNCTASMKLNSNRIYMRFTPAHLEGNSTQALQEMWHVVYW